MTTWGHGHDRDPGHGLRHPEGRRRVLPRRRDGRHSAAKIKVEIVVSAIPVDSVIETAKKVLYTGHVGDGKIFVYPVSRVVKVRTGEENYDALQDVE